MKVNGLQDGAFQEPSSHELKREKYPESKMHARIWLEVGCSVRMGLGLRVWGVGF